jgi:acyl-coenzyme A synthetase/AMP-(fatty) acid ligase
VGSASAFASGSALIVPKRIVTVDALPRNRLGKLIRRDLIAVATPGAPEFVSRG